MKLFDVNAFFGHWPYWPLPQTSGEAVIQLMDRFGIDHAAITSLRGLHGNWQQANDETMSMANRYPDRLTPVGCISPMNNGGPGALHEMVKTGIRAIRLYPALLQGYDLSSTFDWLRGEEHLQGLGQGDKAGQPLRLTGAGEYAAAGADRAEGGVLRADADIAHQRQSQTAAEAVPVDRRD